jgi:hypothetical protein
MRIACLLALGAAAALGSVTEAAAQPFEFRPRPGRMLGIMGYNVTPDGSANALVIERTDQGNGAGSRLLTLGQFGFGFTVSESFPLFLESYVGYARYDPRAVLFGGEDSRRLPLRWNNVTMTTGVGYDIRLSEHWYLRPILNTSLGYAVSDTVLLAWWLDQRTEADLSGFRGRHAHVLGVGGSMVLAYYDHRPEREYDAEFRYTEIHLSTYGDTWAPLRGRSVARTASAWGRARWPTGIEVFGRPLRWVVDGNLSYYLGDQREGLGLGWAVKAGGGVEFDVGRYEIGALGINANRVRLIGRYFYGQHGVSGFSIGLGVSFW